METLLSRPDDVSRSRGFTLLEVMGATFILAFGLLALAGLISKMNVNSSQSRYMSDEALLASEKLEDLNRYPACDPAMVAGGSLTTNITQTNSPAANCLTSQSQSVDYFDTVQISTSNGASTEITTGKNSGGQSGYWSTSHTPNGQATSQFIVGNPPTATGDMLVFNRNWVIEANQPVNGVRRITVLVTLKTPSAGAAAGQFQTSMVRP
jgi:Tfp pilus assembly protein PilV